MRSRRAASRPADPAGNPAGVSSAGASGVHPVVTRAGRPGVDRGTARTRRRFARRQWRRRWLRWKPLLAVVLVLAVLVAGLWIVFFSAVLAAESVRITGNGFLTTGQIRSTAAVPIGRPLARVDLGEVEHRVESLAPVRTVTVTRSWPHTVVIRVTERKPVAVVDLGGDIRGMDDQGVVFRQYAKAPPGLPLVKTTGRTGGEALQEAARVVGSLPASLVGRVDHLAVVTVDQIWLVLRDHRVVLWGSADESAQKAEVLGALLKEPARSYDVSVPGQPTTSQRPPRTPVP